jgi:hypothetical protein
MDRNDILTQKGSMLCSSLPWKSSIISKFSLQGKHTAQLLAAEGKHHFQLLAAEGEHLRSSLLLMTRMMRSSWQRM